MKVGDAMGEAKGNVSRNRDWGRASGGREALGSVVGSTIQAGDATQVGEDGDGVVDDSASNYPGTSGNIVRVVIALGNTIKDEDTLGDVALAKDGDAKGGGDAKEAGLRDDSTGPGPDELGDE
ncbi:unnamed protein product [Ilex paraguariensis]|uniref:Uncharacterized protein n=1 Tax=Ilex paraguariensis TaxID=185542 RepID=A0ABC8SMD9_9AQUA